MPHTRVEIIKMIDLDEPDYEQILKKLNPDDVPILTALTNDPNVAIAVKAISCLGLMNSDKAVAGIQVAVLHPNPVLRVAAAHALRNATAVPAAVQMIDHLLDDNDIGVRKFALKTVSHANISSLKNKVQAMNIKENTEAMKTLSQDVFKAINR